MFALFIKFKKWRRWKWITDSLQIKSFKNKENASLTIDINSTRLLNICNDSWRCPLSVSPQGNEASYPLEMCSHCKYCHCLLLCSSCTELSFIQQMKPTKCLHCIVHYEHFNLCIPVQSSSSGWWWRSAEEYRRVMPDGLWGFSKRTGRSGEQPDCFSGRKVISL